MSQVSLSGKKNPIEIQIYGLFMCQIWKKKSKRNIGQLHTSKTYLGSGSKYDTCRIMTRIV